MWRSISLFAISVFCVFNLQGQEQFSLNGTISEASSNELLIGVNIVFPTLKIGLISNEYGFYAVSLPAGKYPIQISYLGFKTLERFIEIKSNSRLDFQLEEEAASLDEVVLTENIEKTNIRKPQMSVNNLSAASFKNIPAILGEADVIKSIILLPGVSSGGEGASGFNVRGGAADQNLILLDEAIVFNSSHLFGFFSVFNPDAIKDVKLYKGGIPARYGGRISSVLDIYQKEGNSKKFSMNGGLGIVSSRILAEGPIKKDKGAFLVGGRASYAHLFLALTGNDNKAYFYDLNTKLNYKINKNNNVFLSGYFGRDLFGIAESFENVYGNAVANFRWNHLFSDKLFSNLSMIYSDYYYGLRLDLIGFQWDSGIKNYNFKYDFKYYASSKIQLNYGLNNIYYHFNPGEIKPLGEASGITNNRLIQKYANEFSVYVEAEQKLSSKFSAQYGLRWSHFNRLGQTSLNVYENQNPLEFNEDFQTYLAATPISVASFKRGESMASYHNFEPRLGVSYLFNEESSLKFSYNRMAQYLHLLSNTASPTPLDVWAPSGPFIKPQLLDQFAVGYFKDVKQGNFSIETEVFYKNIQNRIDYIDGANLIANDYIEQAILSGQSRAYGLEFLLKKNEGDFKGWLAYTLSKSEQRTAGRTLKETGINNGEWYLTPFDKTHDISVNGSYKLNEKWHINSNFLLQTGQPTNYPTGQYEFKGFTVPIFGPRNTARLPAYHRLDISATLSPKKNTLNRTKSEWFFSIYNLYNRRNAAAVNFRENVDTGNNEAVRTSIFGMVPAVSYNFKF